jgi:hypothetical protein
MRLNKSMKHAGIGSAYNVVNIVFLIERVVICMLCRSRCHYLTDEYFIYVNPRLRSAQFTDADARGSNGGSSSHFNRRRRYRTHCPRGFASPSRVTKITIAT